MRIFKYLLSLVLALSCFCSQMTAAPKPQKKPAASAMKPKPKEKPLPKEPAPSKEGIDFFEKKIRPVLIRHCYECHSGDPAKAKAHLVLDNHDGLRRGGDSGPAVLPGHVETSLIIEAIHYEGLEMPPKGDRKSVV